MLRRKDRQHNQSASMQRGALPVRCTPSWWLFWGSLSLILYTYVGFPILLAVWGRLRPRSIRRGTETPLVSVIIAAYNEAAVIGRKIENTLALDYPRDRMEIIVASDGSDDGTNDVVAGYLEPGLRLLALPRQGKNRTLNAAVAEAQGDILVMTDADSMLVPDALRHLVAPFADPEVGGVGGDYRYAADGAEGRGERTYWGVDRLLKRFQSRAGTMTSATGQIYAVRRELFRPVPMGVTDDFYTSAQVWGAHRRLVFEPQAVAYGPVAASADAEFRRKVRVMTRGLRGVWLSRRLLDPTRYGFIAVQLFTHKVLRRLMALPLLILGIAAARLWPRGWVYRLAAMSQLGLHGAALLGFLLRGTRIGQLKLLSLPFFFDMVNIAAVVALIRLLSGQRHDMWTSQRAEATVPGGRRTASEEMRQ